MNFLLTLTNIRLWLLPLAVFLTVTIFTPSATFAYDGGRESAVVYDAVVEHTTDTTRNGTTGYRVLFGKFAEFLAAKTAPNTTRLGITRNNPADWRATRDLWDNTGYGDILSDANRAAIARGRTPVVDSSWVRNFPEDAGLRGERIPMHHIQGTPITVPLPATRHLDAHMPGGFRYNPGGPGSALPVYPAPNP